MNKENNSLINNLLSLHKKTCDIILYIIVLNFVIIFLDLPNFVEIMNTYLPFLTLWIFLITIIPFFIFIYKFFREGRKKLKLRYRNFAFLFANNTQIFIPIGFLIIAINEKNIIQNNTNLLYIHFAFLLINFLFYKRLFKIDSYGKRVFKKFCIMFLIYLLFFISWVSVDIFTKPRYFNVGGQNLENLNLNNVNVF